MSLTNKGPGHWRMYAKSRLVTIRTLASILNMRVNWVDMERGGNRRPQDNPMKCAAGGNTTAGQRMIKQGI